jgi:hypothetical protein
MPRLFRRSARPNSGFAQWIPLRSCQCLLDRGGDLSRRLAMRSGSLRLVFESGLLVLSRAASESIPGSTDAPTAAPAAAPTGPAIIPPTSAPTTTFPTEVLFAGTTDLVLRLVFIQATAIAPLQVLSERRFIVLQVQVADAFWLNAIPGIGGCVRIAFRFSLPSASPASGSICRALRRLL